MEAKKVTLVIGGLAVLGAIGYFMWKYQPTPPEGKVSITSLKIV